MQNNLHFEEVWRPTLVRAIPRPTPECPISRPGDELGDQVGDVLGDVGLSSCRVMARQLRPISFDSFASMAGHLDRWAAQTLTSPEAWQAALVESHTWLDFATGALGVFEAGE